SEIGFVYGTESRGATTDVVVASHVGAVAVGNAVARHLQPAAVQSPRHLRVEGLRGTHHIARDAASDGDTAGGPHRTVVNLGILCRRQSEVGFVYGTESRGATTDVVVASHVG